MAFKLIVEDALGPQAEVLLRPGVNTLGRSAACDVAIDTPFLSRRHAKLLVSGDRLEVFDLDSHNGLFINGTKVRRAELAPGDAMFVGQRKLVVERVDDGAVELDPESHLARAPLPEPLLAALDALQAQDLREVLASDDATARNLAMLYRVTERDARASSRDEFLRDMLELLREALHAGVAVLLTKDTSGVLQPRAALREGSGVGAAPMPASWRQAERCCEQRTILYSRDQPAVPDLLEPLWPANSPLSALFAPLLHQGQAIGCIVVGRTFQHAGYDLAEVELVAAIAHLLASRLAEPSVESPARRGDDLERLLRMAHPGRMGDRLLEQLGGPFGGPSVTREQGAVVYAELAGVESKLEQTPVEVTERLVGEFHERALQAAARFGGHLEASFAGGVAVVFPGHEPATALRALRAAVRMASLPVVTLAPGLEGAGIRVGVDVGLLTSGLIGQQGRLYTLLGKAVRVAARVADVAQAGQVVATAELRAVLGNQSNVQVVALGPHALRGFARPVELFLLDDPALRREEGTP